MATLNTGGLILPDYAQSMVEGLQNYNRQKVFEQDQAEYQRSVAMRSNLDEARTQFASGDYAGARQTAQSGMNWEVFDGLEDEHQKQVARQITDVANLAYDLKQVKNPADRSAIFAARTPMLKSHGLTDEEIGSTAMNIGNDAYLDGYIGAGTSLAEKIKRRDELYDMAAKYAHEDAADARKIQYNPVTGEGYQVLNDGSLNQVTAGGIKPQLLSTTNPDGTTTYTPYGGSEVPSNISGAVRLMNYKAKAAGVGSIPDNITNLGQFSDFGTQLNRNGVDSSAAGTYQITAGTYREFAPKVFGPNWRNVPISPEAEDAVGRAIYESTGGNVSKLKGRWSSLTDDTARQISGAGWNVAKNVIARGESGGSIPRGNPRPSGNGEFTVGTPRGNFSETREEINGQLYAVQTDPKTGQKSYQSLGPKAKASVDKQEGLDSIRNTYDTLDRIEKHPGLSAVVGIPGVTGGLLAGWVVPGTDAAGFKSLMQNFDAQAYLSQVAKMKGTGALSDAEGRKLSAAIGSLSTSQSETEFRANIKIVKDGLKTAYQRLNSKGGSTASNSAPTRTATNPTTGQKMGLINGKWTAM